ncbi:hypothetical protein C8F04DRAFT_111875 [Mycena alexandri]|uniref:Uncharacterized protein n=1 Tax=Mycena alexandri TaxID=1745969 RepID=A0AAD6T8Z4_9AGAR|nr:hypothetical protein C8F04DRAFT_111875 [Mycena alexandri]
MSDNSLPDEIISEILSPALKVSDDVFSDNSGVSPFSKYSESTSAYLLVCKSWLRVATPLLYSVVILRSKAQAKALGLVLANNKLLGQFIRKLRVEGGYGPPMRTILQSSPHISDLFISFMVYSSDSTDGMCQGLPLVNPTRLILRDERKQLLNKMSSKLTDALATTIPKWDRLVVFDCPYIQESIRADKIARSFAKSQRLHTLYLPKASAVGWAWPELKKCPLRTIHVKKPHEFYEFLPSDPEVQSLLRFPAAAPKAASKAEIPDFAPSLNPSFVPMQSASKEVYEMLCARILYFAMSVEGLMDDSSLRVPKRLPLLLISKTFYRVGLPHYYTHTLLKNTSAVSKFASALSKHPWVAPHVRILNGVADPVWGDAKSALTLASNVSADSALVASVLSQTTALVRVSCHKRSFHREAWDQQLAETTIAWDAFAAMAQCSGGCLREFALKVETRQHASVAPFGKLSALTVLDWNSETVFDDLKSTDPDALSSLEELRITRTSQSFLSALRLMKLDSLRCVALTNTVLAPEKFLMMHGHKLTELDLPYLTVPKLGISIFEMCPNLVFVSFFGYPSSGDPPEADDFYAPQAMPSLTKIVFNMSYWTRNKEHFAGWEEFITNFDDEDSFPNLREIQFKCCTWPTTERDIGKSFWVRWAEMLLERNINLTDKAGKNWRPRLKVA